ncbi:hypothetical protein GCM10023215_53410 [Pseudonocardia yuanmonensis]|uniref:Uncharacterized protein n=1 Tax=Pseudonocardia yuanmonensis TaxID=1095914 RepID=A0ABP8XGF3_9PSEU
MTQTVDGVCEAPGRRVRHPPGVRGTRQVCEATGRCARQPVGVPGGRRVREALGGYAGRQERARAARALAMTASHIRRTHSARRLTPVAERSHIREVGDTSRRQDVARISGCGAGTRRGAFPGPTAPGGLHRE